MKLFFVVMALLAVLATACGQQTEFKKPLARIDATYNLAVLDAKTGAIISSRTYPSESYITGFIDILYAYWAYTTQSVLDTGNTSRSVTYHATWYAWGTAGTDTVGIVVGSGTNAVAMADYALQTKILHGTTSGKLDYSNTTFVAPSTSSNTRSFQIVRSFSNGSGGGITVNEIGVYYAQGASAYKFMGIRDVVPGGQTLDPGKVLTITYTISITL